MKSRTGQLLRLFQKENVFPFTSIEEDETKWKELVKKGKEEVQKYLQVENDNLNALSATEELTLQEKKKRKTFLHDLKLLKVIFKE